MREWKLWCRFSQCLAHKNGRGSGGDRVRVTHNPSWGELRNWSISLRRFASNLYLSFTKLEIGSDFLIAFASYKEGIPDKIQLNKYSSSKENWNFHACLSTQPVFFFFLSWSVYPLFHLVSAFLVPLSASLFLFTVFLLLS